MNNLEENYMKKEFDEIVKLCEEKIQEYGDHASYFMEPATEEEILEWENATNTRIPETYREWLKLTKSCQICQTTASYFFPKVEQPKYIPEDYVVIGYVVGDGEVMCFSKSKGNFITYFEGKVNEEYKDFIEVLEETKRMASGIALKLSLTEEKIQAMIARSEARKKKRGENV